jgi:mercuric ion binding protein
MIGAMLIASTAAFGAERTVVLTVDNMTCASCSYIVKQSLARVAGVRAVDVSFERKTAVVIFEDAQAGIADLTAATAGSGFPSRLMEQQGAQPR